MPRARTVADAMEVRRGTVERIANQHAQNFVIVGHITVNGTGEAVANVTFPVMFVKIPKFSTGVSMGAGQAISPGLMPTCSIVVLRWDVRVRDDGTDVYVGASLGIVNTGVTDQVVEVQWQAEGVGLRGPVPNAAQ